MLMENSCFIFLGFDNFTCSKCRNLHDLVVATTYLLAKMFSLLFFSIQENKTVEVWFISTKSLINSS